MGIPRLKLFVFRAGFFFYDSNSMPKICTFAIVIFDPILRTILHWTLLIFLVNDNLYFLSIFPVISFFIICFEFDMVDTSPVESTNISFRNLSFCSRWVLDSFEIGFIVCD